MHSVQCTVDNCVINVKQYLNHSGLVKEGIYLLYLLKESNESVCKTEKVVASFKHELDEECLSVSDWADARLCSICIVSRGNKARVVVFF